jgi:hypothetical protein
MATKTQDSVRERCGNYRHRHLKIIEKTLILVPSSAVEEFLTLRTRDVTDGLLYHRYLMTRLSLQVVYL